MSDKTEAETISQIIDKFHEVASQYGPDVTELAVRTAYFDALITVAAGVLLIGGTVMSAFFAWRFWRRVNPQQPEKLGPLLALAPTSLLACLGIGVAARHAAVWIWACIGLFDPTVYLAAKAVGWS